MRAWKIVLSFVLELLITTGNVHAQDEYTYTIRVYSGQQGNFGGTNMISKENVKAGESISELFDMGKVSLENDKYYIKGFKESGKDNSTSIEPLPSTADRDMDYVVVYGIKGNGTTYRINYVDQSGNPLADSVEYYGNVGDQPVVAFLYIEGYQPQAYNLVRTLSANSAENEFTFVYSPIAQLPTPTTPATEETTPAPATPTTPATTTPEAGNETTPTTPATEPDTPSDETETPAVPGEETTPTPQEPEEIINLDEEDVPLAGPEDQNSKNTKDSAVSWPLWIGGGLLVLLLIGGIVYLLKQKNKDEK